MRKFSLLGFLLLIFAAAVLFSDGVRQALQEDSEKLWALCAGNGTKTSLAVAFFGETENEEKVIEPKTLVAGLDILPKYRAALEANPRDLALWLLAAMDSPTHDGNYHNTDWRGKNQVQRSTRENNLIALSAKFPDNPEILALRWIYGAGGYGPIDTRPPGPSNSADPNWSVLSPNNPANASAIPGGGFSGKYERWKRLAPGMYLEELKMVRRAQKLDPQNAFWWGAELHCLLALRRDGETWATLRAGAQKSTWNDYLYDVAYRQFQARKRYGFSRGASDDLGFVAAILFPHFARQRECARQVSDNCRGLHLLGQHQTAFRGALDFARISRLQRNYSKSYIGSLVGTAMTAISLRAGPLQWVKPRVRAGAATPLAIHPDFVGTAASQLGFPALAREAALLDADFVKGRPPRLPASTLFRGVDTPNAALALALEGARPLVLAPIIPCGLWLIMLWGLSRTRRLRGLLRVENTASNERAESYFSLAPLLALILLLFFCGATFYSSQGVGLGDTFWQIVAFSASEIGGLSEIVVWVFGFVPLFLFVWALWRGYFRTRMGASLLSRVKAIAAPSDDELVRYDLSPLLLLAMAITLGTLFFAFLIGLFLLPIYDKSFREATGGTGFLRLFLFGVFAILPLVFLSSRGSNRRALLRESGFFTRRLLVRQIVLCGVLWLLLLFAGKGSHAQLSGELETHLRVGETAQIRRTSGV